MEALQKFFSNPLSWIVGIGAAVAAFFAGRATTASPEPATSNSVTANPTALADHAVFKTGNVIGGLKPDGTILTAEEVGSEFTIDTVKYRITGYADPTVPDSTLLRMKGGQGPVVSGNVYRKADGFPIETYAVDIKGDKLLIDEKMFREDVKAAQATQKAYGFTMERAVAVNDIAEAELQGTDYAGKAKDLRAVTVEGKYQGKPITRQIILYSNSIGDTYMVGAYTNDKVPKPVFLHTDANKPGTFHISVNDGPSEPVPVFKRFPVRPVSLRESNEEIRAAMQTHIDDENEGRFHVEGRNNAGIKQFLKQIAEGVTMPGKPEPVKGLDIDHLSKNVDAFPSGNPNARLPQLASIPAGKYA